MAVRKIRDVIEEDDERKMRPSSLLMITSASILSLMIIYNALATKPLRPLPPHATTRMEVSAPDVASHTVVFKYDAQVEDLQRELLATGHYKGMVDGVMGQRTQTAIQNYQHDNALQESGVVSAELINHIRYTRKVKAAAEFTGSFEKQTNVDAVAVVQPVVKKLVVSKPTKQQQVLRVQMTLANLGYDLGEPSGALDEQTRSAILKFQMDNGLAMEGKIDAGLLAALNKPNN